MRLIDTETGKFVDFTDLKDIPPYSILSHTWDPNGEQTYREVVKIQEKHQHQSPPPEEDAPSNSCLDNPGAIPSATRTPLEVPPTSCSPPLVSSTSPRSYSIFLGVLPLWWALISMVHGWISLILGPATPSPLHPSPELPNDIQTSPKSPSTSRRIWDPDSGLSEKVRKACEIARRDGYRYIWIDSCCINKDSSSELSEAINSMFNWYRGAQVCYAFLVDVPSDEDVRAEDSKLRESRWFKRGWTLQELVAPLLVVFLSKDWKGLGTKHGLTDVIQKVTSIDIEILTHERALSEESIANRMGWASRRETTRVEDEAYSLLGIFDITMPTLYGEGRYAFRRLQEEILGRIPDQSLFAWGSRDILTFPMTACEMEGSVTDTRTLLASSPTNFTMKNNQITLKTEGSIASLLPVEEYTHTPYGIRTQLCLLPLQRLNPNFKISVFDGDPTVSWYLAILRAQKATNPQGLLSQLCYLRQSDKANIQLLYRGILQLRPLGFIHASTSSLYELSPNIIARVGKLETHLKTVYLPHPKPSKSASTRQLESFVAYGFGVNRLSLTIPMWVQDVLRAGGFTVSNIQGLTTEHYLDSFSFTLLHATFNIHIQYQHMAPGFRHFLQSGTLINARAWILPPGDEGLCTTAIQSSPPSDSATWVSLKPSLQSDMTLPSQCLVLTTDFGDEATVLLWLGLDLTAPFRYNLRVDVAPHISGEVDLSIQPHSKDTQTDGLQVALKLPYKTLDFILPGSTSRVLEMKGYSAHLALEPSLGDTHSYSLTLSTDTDAGKFAIVVKYLQVHRLGNTVLARDDLNLDFDSESESESGPGGYRKRQQIVIIARITLEASDDGFETVQDGPHVVAWEDRYPWNLSLGRKDIVLTTPSRDSLTLKLGFNLAWLYEYYLIIDIKPGLSSALNCNGRHDEEPYYMTNWAHRSISLTLPTHVKHALQAQGFHVRFERLTGGGASGDPIHHLLTLTDIRADVDIVIKYLHNLTTKYPKHGSYPNSRKVKKRYPLLQATPQLESDSGLPAPTAKASVKRCRQKLTFKASVQTFASRSVQIGDAPSQLAVHDEVTAEVDWAREDLLSWDQEWERHPCRKNITLTLPMGRQLVLRLGFDLMWYSEYCLVVEVNPPTPLPPLWSGDSGGPPMPDYELGEDSMEYIRQAMGQSTESGVGQPAEAPDDDSELVVANRSTLGGPPVRSGEPEDAGNLVPRERPELRVGAEVETRLGATKLLTRSATQTPTQGDAGRRRQAQGRRKTR